MMSQYGRPDAQHIAVLWTAGQSTGDQHRTYTEADAAKNEHIKIFVIGELRFRSNLQHNTNNNNKYSICLRHISSNKTIQRCITLYIDYRLP